MTVSQSAGLAPVSPRERIATLDVIRGFALLGIFLMNVEYFSRSTLTIAQGMPPDLEGIDFLAGWLIYVFVQGKFWTMFSLLFGMGFAVMLSRAQVAGRGFVGLYLRRTLALLGFGLAHGILVWSGDILHAYALLAFLLLLFRRMPADRLWRWGIGLYAVPLIGMAVALAVMPAEGPADDTPNDTAMAQVVETDATEGEAEARFAALVAESERVMREGRYGEAVVQRARELAVHLNMLVFGGWLILGMFLIGAWLLRSGAIVEPARHLRLFRWLTFAGLPAGIALALLSASVGTSFALDQADPAMLRALLLMLLANPLICLGYVGAIVLALQSPRWAPRLAILAPAGRMALTNYLLQSVVGTLLFYGYGLGLYGQVPRAWQVVLVAGVFALQLAFSAWWLERFRYGPAEWLWRSITYLRLQPMRRG
ncbi:DUF418 domain-containing protein [Rehaibacterium terrae]|jgi:uncharacterized protein|uniref:DUF418 domain-containing protein n=1 Tax=Rehaibacterium terrae TaxID=1341696 RepID=A0A7W7XZI1_9GAMM|nr:DUF418 domain-containing protein [Rehaibacterium terrae]MBB5015306.1 uncharacterized protein [Rehaibacterium terrae]